MGEGRRPHPADLTAVEAGRVIARLARQVEIALSGTDLSISQYRVLMLLSKGATAQSALASGLTVRPPSVTGVVDGLVRRGLVSRDHEATGDRRRVAHVLTEHGRTLLDEADAAVESRLAEITGYLESAGEARGALDGLRLWGAALDAQHADRLKRRAGERA